MSRPASIAALVAGVLWRTRASRAVESALLGAAAGLATASAIELSAGQPWSLEGLATQLLSACACGGAWWVEHRRDLRDAARRADRELGQAGALVTAFEQERDGARLAALLAQRVLERLPSDGAARAARRPALAFVAAPLALLGLYFALPRRTPGLPPGVPEMVGRVALALGRAATQDPDQAAELAELASGLEAAATQPDGSSEVARQLAEAARRLEASAAQASGGAASELAAADLARAALERLEAETGLRGGPAGGARGGSGGGPDGTTAGFGMQNQPDGRTMVGSPRGARDRATPSPSAPAPRSPPAPEAGTVAGRWWTPEYDDVVAAWRAAAADRK